MNYIQLASLTTTYPYQINFNVTGVQAVFHVTAHLSYEVLITKTKFNKNKLSRKSLKAIPKELLDDKYADTYMIDFMAKITDKGKSYYTIDLTKSGNAFRVFATVLSIIRKSVAELHPKYLVFSAKEPSRQKLYQRFIKFVSTLGYELNAIWQDGGKEKVYLLKKV